MNQKVQQNTWIDSKVNLKLKLASLWTSLMFLIIYLDYFHLYMPSSLADIQTGKVYVFDINQGFLMIAFIMVTIPSLMIFLSVVMSAKINRWTNIIIATIYIPFILFNLSGKAWTHMITGAIIQVILLFIIIHYAWKWSRTDT